MTMPLWQGIATVAAVVLGTLVTRFLPFLLFPRRKAYPEIHSILRQSAALRRDRPFSDLLPEGRVGNRFFPSGCRS